jgi:hypothetical protein
VTHPVFPVGHIAIRHRVSVLSQVSSTTPGATGRPIAAVVSAETNAVALIQPTADAAPAEMGPSSSIAQFQCEPREYAFRYADAETFVR